TATAKTGTAMTCEILGGPPRTSSAAITTKLPVMCAVNKPRVKKPITSTMPAIKLSRAGSRLSSRTLSEGARDEWDFASKTPDSIDTNIFPLHLRLRPCGAITEVIDRELRNYQTEAHG